MLPKYFLLIPIPISQISFQFPLSTNLSLNNKLLINPLLPNKINNTHHIRISLILAADLSPLIDIRRDPTNTKSQAIKIDEAVKRIISTGVQLLMNCREHS